jgi:hypothetical protein
MKSLHSLADVGISEKYKFPSTPDKENAVDFILYPDGFA